MRNDARFTIPGQLAERAQQRPGHPFLLFEGKRFSFEEAYAGCRSIAQWLLQHGLERGDRVVLLLGNSVEMVLAWLGIVAAGGIAVPVNPELTRNEIALLIEKSGPRFAVCPAKIRDLLPLSLPCVAVGRGEARGRIVGDFASILRTPGSGVLPVIDPEDPASFVFTSGTSGEPKAVVQPHRTYVVTGQSFPYWMGLTDRDVMYTCLPLFHINAQAYSLMSAICGGITLALGRRFSATTFWSELNSVGASQFNAIGSMLSILFRRREGPGKSDVRACFSAPAFDRETHLAIEERFNLKLLIGYGLSESPFGTITPLSGDPGIGSVGKPRFHPEMKFINRLRLVDDRGIHVNSGEPGEILLQNNATMLGYWEEEAGTEQALRDGWLHTGDLGRFESDFLYYMGRKTEMIRRRGENISPVEVEAVIESHAEVVECAVFGVPSELSEEDVAVAIVAANKTIDLEDLIAWCSERLAQYKLPRFISIVASLPRGPTQKVIKEELAAAWDQGELPIVDRERDSAVR